MILIDFQGGSHGNFLEMVLNSIYFGKRLDAFSQNGTSHSKPYKESDVKFLADHHSLLTHIIMILYQIMKRLY